MHPPIAQLERVCTEDYMLPDSNLLLKKGTTIQIPVIGLHYDPKYYPDPYTFNPYRFSLEERTKRSQYVYLPFGTGPRNCIGMFTKQVYRKKMYNLIIFNRFKICPDEYQARYSSFTKRLLC